MPDRDALIQGLTRPAVIQILRAAGFQAVRPSALDAIVSLAGQHLVFLGRQTAVHAAIAGRGPAFPTISDVRLAMVDAGVFTDTGVAAASATTAITAVEEAWRGKLRKPLSRVGRRKRNKEEPTSKLPPTTERIDSVSGDTTGEGAKDGTTSNLSPHNSHLEPDPTAMTDVEPEPEPEPDATMPSKDQSTKSDITAPTVSESPSNSEPAVEAPPESSSSKIVSDSDATSTSDSDFESDSEAAQQLRRNEELRRLSQDTADVRAFISWVTGDVNREIMRISGRLRRPTSTADVPPILPPPPPPPPRDAADTGPQSVARPVSNPDQIAAADSVAEAPSATKLDDPTTSLVVLEKDATVPVVEIIDDNDFSADYVTALKKKHSRTGDSARFHGSIIGAPADSPRQVTIEGGFAASLAEWHAYVREKNAARLESLEAHSYDELPTPGKTTPSPDKMVVQSSSPVE